MCKFRVLCCKRTNKFLIITLQHYVFFYTRKILFFKKISKNSTHTHKKKYIYIHRHTCKYTDYIPTTSHHISILNIVQVIVWSYGVSYQHIILYQHINIESIVPKHLARKQFSVLCVSYQDECK